MYVHSKIPARNLYRQSFRICRETIISAFWGALDWFSASLFFSRFSIRRRTIQSPNSRLIQFLVISYTTVSTIASRSGSKLGTGSSIPLLSTSSTFSSPSATPAITTPSSATLLSTSTMVSDSSSARPVAYGAHSSQYGIAASSGISSPQALGIQSSGTPSGGFSPLAHPSSNVSPSIQAANASQGYAPPSTAWTSRRPPRASASPAYSAFNTSRYPQGPTTAFSGSMPQYRNASQSTFPACQTDSGYDAKSCSCVTRVNSWYESHATATTTPIVCEYSMAKGYVYSFTPGCFPQTSTLLAEPYVAPDECCSGPCRIRVEGVRLVYWAPDDAPTTNATNTTLPMNPSSNITLASRVPEAPYTLVEDGFTFTSPSVYVIYSSISASQSCVARFDSSVLRGSTHYVTRGYP